jgi:hypothetical protein
LKEKMRLLPNSASTRRNSGWKMMTSAMARKTEKRCSRLLMTESSSSSEMSARLSSRTIKPVKMRAPRVARKNR